MLARALIPLVELTGEPVTFGKSWAFNMTRVLPGRGVQAWSTPAEVEPRPDGMGVLVFIQDMGNAGKLPGQQGVIRKTP